MKIADKYVDREDLEKKMNWAAKEYELGANREHWMKIHEARKRREEEMLRTGNIGCRRKYCPIFTSK